MRLVGLTEKKLESLVEAACERLKERAGYLPDGHLSTSPAGIMHRAAELELHDLRRAITDGTVQ